jgi:hypothetical protein
MNRRVLRRLGLLCALAWLLHGDLALAVLLSSNNANNTALSLSDAGGPGDPLQPGFVSVGRSSTGNGTVTYLGGGWVITAGHVTINNFLNGPQNPATPVRFGGNPYLVDMSSIHFLHNPDNSLADLKVFRLQTDPLLPSVIPGLINDVGPSGRVIMIGNGLTAGAQHFWSVNKTNPAWVWTDGPPPPNPPGPGSNDYSGFDADNQGSHTIRWGENEVLSTGVLGVGFTTQFDSLLYTFRTPRASEAQASNGDSGGPGFTLVGGQWKLSGIMFTVSLPLNNQPDETVLFGDQTLFYDLSLYRDEILAIVPEPSSYVLALVAAAAVGLVRRRRRR